MTGDLLRVAETTIFYKEVRVVEMANGSPAYQLERLGAARDLISRTVNMRFSAQQHGLVVNWRERLDIVLGELPADLAEAEVEERARTEKATALVVLAQRPAECSGRFSRHRKDNIDVSPLQPSRDREGRGPAARPHRQGPGPHGRTS